MFKFLLLAVLGLSCVNPCFAQPEQPSGNNTAENRPAARGFTDQTTGMEFVPVPGGCFQRGDTFGNGSDREKPAYEICVSDFNIGRYEVTQGQWRRITGTNPSSFSSCGDDCPVENVSWNDVQEFISKLNRQSGKNYRLPTESEWEYACRSGGKREKYCGGDNLDVVAWYEANSGGKTHRVGTRQPNGLGIYDMTGNVWEWVQDYYEDPIYKGLRNSRYPATEFDNRVLRGGAWNKDDWFVRATIRFEFPPRNRFNNLGFRLALPAVK